MTDGEKDLLALIQRYGYNLVRLSEAEESLESKIYRITPSYSNTGGGSGNVSRSRVENHAEKIMKLKREIAEYKRKIAIVETALQCPELSRLERRVLNWIADGGKLASFAEAEGIYISRIYKIRDKALKKALSSPETTK